MKETSHEQTMVEFEKFLEDYETVQHISSGASHYEGGFTEGEFISISQETGYLYFDISWGFINDKERTVYNKHLRISIEDLMDKELNFTSKVKAVQVI